MKTIKVITIYSLLFFVNFTILFSQKKDVVEILTIQRKKSGFDIYVVNNHIIPHYIQIRLKNAEIFNTNITFPYEKVVGPKTKKQFLFSLIPKEKNKAYKLNLSYHYVKGNPFSKLYKKGFTYLFPYQHGTKRKVSQGFNTDGTHKYANTYAIDFDMPIGSAVHAARGGIVVEIKQDSTIGGASEKFTDYNNYINIIHKDGTFANYSHLRYNGVLVKVGDKVQAGDKIGFSGKTGIASGPHLHFDVRIPNRDGSLYSIPIDFFNHEKKHIVPEEGRYYYAIHPNKPDFAIVLGSNLINANFESYTKTISGPEGFEFRTEKIDDTIIAYIQNRYKKSYKVQIDVKTEGVSLSKKFPVIMEIPAKTEKFLSLFYYEKNATLIKMKPQVQILKK